MATLIVGCGYLGRRVAGILRARGERVFGTTRGADRAAQLERLGIEPIVADVADAASLARLPRADRVVYCVGFDRTAGADQRRVVVDGLEAVIRHLAADRLVYASTTGVYAQEDGGWIDEDAATQPRHASGQLALEAERLVARSPVRSRLILRFAGLYGPGRIIRRAALLAGEPIEVDPEAFLNLVHIDDAAGAVAAALDRGPEEPVVNICDDRPVRRREYYRLAARLLGAPEPTFSAATGAGEPNRRIGNARMKQRLGVNLAYPDITTGLAAAIAEEREAPTP